MRVARYVLRLARERERDGLDSAACHRTFQALIRALPVAFRGDIPSRRLAELESVLDRFLRDFNKEVTFSDKTLDNSTISGKIKLRNPHTDGKSEGDWVTINGTHVQIGKGGQITKGPANLKGQPIASAGPKRPENEPEILKQFNRYEPGSKTEAEKLAQVNPKGYKNNCQRCVLAYELIERGYDVTAKPYSPKDPLGAIGLRALKLTDPAHLDPDYHFLREESHFENDVNAFFDTWGDGARAIIRVTWHERYGGDALSRMHALIAKRVGGKIVYLDPQTNKVRNINETLKNTSDKFPPWILRVDNKEVSDLITYAVQNREEVV